METCGNRGGATSRGDYWNEGRSDSSNFIPWTVRKGGGKGAVGDVGRETEGRTPTEADLYLAGTQVGLGH